MSLRTDIHATFEAITPPTGGMAERVVETARREARAHYRRNRIVLRMRAPLALIAALVAVALVVAVFVGARLIQPAPTPIPAAPGHKAAFSAQLAELEARPVNLPAATSEADCPATPNTNLDYDYGTGPVYGNGGPQANTSWGYYWDVSYYPDPLLAGPVLIRGRDLISGETLIFSGPRAAGPNASGVGQPSGWRTEAVIDMSAKPDAFNSGHPGFRVRQALTKKFIGCFGIQIDGPAFTETITGFAAP